MMMLSTLVAELATHLTNKQNPKMRCNRFKSELCDNSKQKSVPKSTTFNEIKKMYTTCSASDKSSVASTPIAKKCTPFSKDVLERREKKKYSAYTYKEKSSEPTEQRGPNLRSSACFASSARCLGTPRRPTPSKTVKSLLSLPRQTTNPNPSKAASSQNFATMQTEGPSNKKQKAALPQSILNTTQTLIRSSNTKPNKKLLLELLEKFKAALLQDNEDEENQGCCVNIPGPKEASHIKQMCDKAVQCDLQQNNHTMWDIYDALKELLPTHKNSTSGVSNRAKVHTQKRNFSHSSYMHPSISTINSDNTDSDYTSGSTSSVISVSSTPAVYITPERSFAEKRTYCSQLFINIGSHSESVTTERPRSVEEWQIMFDFNDEALMEEYEQESFKESICSGGYYKQEDNSRLDALIVGVFERCPSGGEIFDKLEAELAIISESLNQSADIIKKLSRT